MGAVVDARLTICVTSISIQSLYNMRRMRVPLHGNKAAAMHDFAEMPLFQDSLQLLRHKSNALAVPQALVAKCRP